MVTRVEIERELCRKDVGEYSARVLGRRLYRHQEGWLREMLGHKRVVIVAPPGTYKSSTVRMLLEWEIGRDVESTTLLVMNTATQAQRQVMTIGDTLVGNERYREVFPWVEADAKRGWSHDTLFVRRKKVQPDATLYGCGIDGPYQGAHVDRIVIDDPTDQQDVLSPAKMEQQRERLHGVLIDRVAEGGSVVCIMTRWGEGDLLRDFREMGFEVLEHPIEGRYPWGRLLCPEVWGDEKLLTIRNGKGDVAGLGGQLYDLTYMCDPARAEGALLKREWWRFYNELPAEVEMQVQSWDLSTGRGALGDYTAYQMWRRTPEGYWVVDAGRWRLEMDELVQRMRLQYERAEPRPRAVLVEEAGSSIPVVQYLQRHTRLPIVGVKPGTRDKVARVRAVQGLIEAGRVWLPARAAWLAAFLDEAAAFPGGRYDDQVDAMSQALAWLDRTGRTGHIGHSFVPRDVRQRERGRHIRTFSRTE